MDEFKNPLPPEAHAALEAAHDFLRSHIYGETWRLHSAEDAFKAVRVALMMEKYGTPEPPGRTVKPAPSFQPPETCPDCLAGVPFGADGHHINHRR
jgi:hypothetical protein